MNSLPQKRRYDVDWLRSLAFMLLIFYHIGMFYVADWGWHVKSAYQSEWLQNLMMLVNQWRMPLIFLISGMVLSLIEHKYGGLKLLKTRFFRIFLPLIIGMYFIVPVQSYYEAIQQLGYTGGYWTFWFEYINPNTTLYTEHHHSPLGLLTWNHLWYLTYLWFYTLVYLMLRPVLMPLTDKLQQKKIGLGLVLLLPISLQAFYTLNLAADYPRTHALTDDWYTHAQFFTVFILGYLLAKMPFSWEKIIEKRRLLLVLAIMGYSLIFLERNDLTDWVKADELGRYISVFWIAMNSWAWMLMLVGYAGAYLNRPSQALDTINEAILPWYILHQSVIILVAMQIADYQLGGFWEPMLVVLGTLSLCQIGYEVIRRSNILRLCMGMKRMTDITKKDSGYSPVVVAGHEPS